MRKQSEGVLTLMTTCYTMQTTLGLFGIQKKEDIEKLEKVLQTLSVQYLFFYTSTKAGKELIEKYLARDMLRPLDYIYITRKSNTIIENVVTLGWNDRVKRSYLFADVHSRIAVFNAYVEFECRLIGNILGFTGTFTVKARKNGDLYIGARVFKDKKLIERLDYTEEESEKTPQIIRAIEALR